MPIALIVLKLGISCSSMNLEKKNSSKASIILSKTKSYKTIFLSDNHQIYKNTDLVWTKEKGIGCGLGSDLDLYLDPARGSKIA